MLAGGDGLLQRGRALLGRRGIEEERVAPVGQRRIEIGGPVRDVVRAGDRREASGVASDQQKAREQAIIANRQPALVPDRNERVGEVLRRADAPGRAVDNDADCPDRQSGSPAGVVPPSLPGLPRPATPCLRQGKTGKPGTGP
jgi:hypothetical protein